MLEALYLFDLVLRGCAASVLDARWISPCASSSISWSEGGVIEAAQRKFFSKLLNGWLTSTKPFCNGILRFVRIPVGVGIIPVERNL
jgi:hypothetical protein